MKNLSVKIAAAMTAALISVSGAALAANREISAVEAPAAASAAAGETVNTGKSKDTYEIGSVSKTVCAVCCMKLAEAGKLDLDAPVTEYVPEFKMKDERYKEITTRMLLDHTSGIMGGVGGAFAVYGDGDTEFHDTFLERFAGQELKADPGEYGVYCNSGFELAEIVIERVSGMDYDEFVLKEIAEPLGLENFGTGYLGTDRERFVTTKSGGTRNLGWMNCAELASGGLWTSADELALFSAVLTDGNDFLTKESKRQINNMLSDEDGFGLGIDNSMLYPYSAYGKKAVWKGGGVGDFRTSLTVLPEDNLSIAVCSQCQDGYYPMMMCEDIILSVLKEEGLISEEDIAKGNARVEEMLTEKECEEIPVPDSLKKYAGLYACYGFYYVDFDGNCMTLEKMNADFRQVYRLRYGGDGKFYSYDGNYISAVGAAASFGYKTGQKRGAMTVWFEETRGKTFLSMTCTEEVKGIGVLDTTSQILEKLPEANAPEKAVNAWKEREGNIYYIACQPYNSMEFLRSPALSVRETDGYICGYNPFNPGSEEHTAVITDENHSFPNTDVGGLSGSRDLVSYEIAYENGAEYLRGEAYTYNTYRLYDSFEGTSSLSGQYVLDTPDDAVWFKVSPEDSGAVLRLSPSEKASWFVYDKHGSCIASSLYIDGSDRVILPEGGMVLLAGKSGEYVDIGR